MFEKIFIFVKSIGIFSMMYLTDIFIFFYFFLLFFFINFFIDGGKFVIFVL
jgi:hypothetical protein